MGTVGWDELPVNSIHTSYKVWTGFQLANSGKNLGKLKVWDTV